MPNLPTNHTKKTVDRFVFTQTYLLSSAYSTEEFFLCAPGMGVILSVKVRYGG